MDENKTEGFCESCNRWVLRDDMIATNITVFGQDAHSKEEILRFRFCPECHEKQRKRWVSEDGNELLWNNRLRNQS